MKRGGAGGVHCLSWAGGVWVCSDTSEVRDVVVLLQHSQGGGVQVIGHACAAHCWRWRGLATNRAVQRQGAGAVPGPIGRGFKRTCQHQRWRDRTGWHELLVEFLLQVTSKPAASRILLSFDGNPKTPPTWSTVVLRRAGRRVASVAAQRAVGTGARRPPLTG